MSTTSPPRTAPAKKKLKFNSYPWYSPRFWHGMRFGDWVKLLKRGHFRIHPLRIAMACLITPCAAANSCFALFERLIYGRKVAGTEISEPPIFIIGHWRSGTTFLHELMVCDERFACSTYYECFAPNHFLVTNWIFPTLLKPLLPRKRPMDNMETGWGRPQEDEFALVAMGAPTPYVKMAFPNNPPAYSEFLDMEGCARGDLDRWRHDMKLFVQKLTFKKRKRLIMKSPPHTGRIEELARLFPGAKFVHIVRDPSTVFPSTRRLWISLDAAQGFQHPHHRDLDEYVLSSFERMYRGFNRQRGSIPAEQLCELRYEELVKDPVGQVRRIYEQLKLGDFEPARAKIEEHVKGQKDYKTNQHELEDGIRAEIRARWGDYLERYGYE